MKKYKINHPHAGPYGWEIGDTRLNRLCGDMTLKQAEFVLHAIEVCQALESKSDDLTIKKSESL